MDGQIDRQTDRRSTGHRSSHPQSCLWLCLGNKSTLVEIMENVVDPIRLHDNKVNVYCVLLQVTVDFLISEQDYDPSSPPTLVCCECLNKTIKKSNHAFSAMSKNSDWRTNK